MGLWMCKAEETQHAVLLHSSKREECRKGRKRLEPGSKRFQSHRPSPVITAAPLRVALRRSSTSLHYRNSCLNTAIFCLQSGTGMWSGWCVLNVNVSQPPGCKWADHLTKAFAWGYRTVTHCSALWIAAGWTLIRGNWQQLLDKAAYKACIYDAAWVPWAWASLMSDAGVEASGAQQHDNACLCAWSTPKERMRTQ